jgi:hypothetical protein
VVTTDRRWQPGAHQKATSKPAARAPGRAEIAVLTMPFDLMRHDLLMTLKPVSRERIQSIVDDLFMPLLAAYRD